MTRIASSVPIVALRNEKDTTLICNRIFTIHLQLIEFQYLKIY